MNWENTIELESRTYKCSHCNKFVASKEGYISDRRSSVKPTIYICPSCARPTYFDDRNKQSPAPLLGNQVGYLPKIVKEMYEEARQCTTVEAFTASVLTLRKLLMHIAIEKEADENKNFYYYVEYLADKGYVPPDGKDWVHKIRQKGNEANHEIIQMTQKDCDELLIFVEMLLKFIYEFPKRMGR